MKPKLTFEVRRHRNQWSVYAKDFSTYHFVGMSESFCKEMAEFLSK